MFWDRISEFPGRVKLTDPTTGDFVIRDTERSEGEVQDEGTTLDRIGIDEALYSYFDVGQECSDLIAEDLSDTGVTITSGLSGSVKYGKVGSLVIVYVKLVVDTAISGNMAIAGGIPSDYRPPMDKLEPTRASDRVKVRLGTDGRLTVDGNFPIGTQFCCDICWHE